MHSTMEAERNTTNGKVQFILLYMFTIKLMTFFYTNLCRSLRFCRVDNSRYFITVDPCCTVTFVSWTNFFWASSQEVTSRVSSQIELNWTLVSGWWCKTHSQSSTFDSERTKWASLINCWMLLRITEDGQRWQSRPEVVGFLLKTFFSRGTKENNCTSLPSAPRPSLLTVREWGGGVLHDVHLRMQTR